jgi:hypothetical protein
MTVTESSVPMRTKALGIGAVVCAVWARATRPPGVHTKPSSRPATPALSMLRRVGASAGAATGNGKFSMASP